MRKSVLALVIGTAIAGSCAGPAGAVTIGADLNRIPNATYGCELAPGVDFIGNRALYPTGQSTCTYVATSAGGAEIPQAQFPGGVLTAVRVRVGPVTGPMQATILRATRSAAGFQCCYHAGESAAFTPTPNSVTTVPVRLPMRNDLNPSFGETVDYLGITVLAPGVPIPMQDLGSPNDFPGQGAIAFFPHQRPGDVRVDGNGLGALVPLVNGEFTPLCTAGAAAASRLSATARRRTRAAATGCRNAVTAAGNRARLRRGRANIALTCNAGISCIGTLRLQTRNRSGATLAKSAVNLAPNATATLKLKLTSAGRRLMAGKSKRKVWMNATLAAADGSQVLVAGRITLKR